MAADGGTSFAHSHHKEAYHRTYEQQRHCPASGGFGEGGEVKTRLEGLAEQLAVLESLGFAGAGLYRYASLWENPAWPDLAAAERQALSDRWVTASPGY